MVNKLATMVPELRAAAPFYGAPPPPEDVAKIKAELLIQHGGNGTRLAATWPDYDAALTKAGVAHAGYIYPTRSTVSTTTPRRASTR